ncbi:MAG: hypothetical protein MI808_18070 [Pseudomonadales bacterium]|nr:hypothetical protein [Pseudomonadales bacterium]
MLKKVVPTVFYSDVDVGIDLFVNTLGFEVVHREDADQIFVILNRDGVEIHLIQNAEYAEKDRPQLRLETDDIESLFDEVESKNIDLLHPKLAKVTKRPWGCSEFALLDQTLVCIVVYQW